MPPPFPNLPGMYNEVDFPLFTISRIYILLENFFREINKWFYFTIRSVGILIFFFSCFVDDEDVNQGDMDDDDDHSEDIYPPALPPKRGPVMSSNR